MTYQQSSDDGNRYAWQHDDHGRSPFDGFDAFKSGQFRGGHDFGWDRFPVERAFGDYSLFIGGPTQDRYPGTNRMDIAFGRDGDDKLQGARMADDLMGGKGDDQLRGAGGADHLDGGLGRDELYGGVDADALRGGDGADYLDEGAGHGDLEGGRGDDVLVGGLGADAFAISPDSGNDVIKDFVAGPGMFDHLAIRDIKPEELRFEETARGVLISWDTEKGDGSVLLEGVEKSELAQSDFMFADDRYLIQPTNADADRVGAISFATTEGGNIRAPNAGRESFTDDAFRFDDFNVKFGSDTGDTFKATGDRDAYFGLGGDDRLYGGAGDDHLAGGAGRDILDGGRGMDDLRGGDGADKIYGGEEADNLMGEKGADLLYAGAGHDMLDGGEGDDILNGGDGADAFIVAHGSGDDVVTGGFDAGPGAFDHIAFTDILPDEVTVADQVSAHNDGHVGVLVSWSDGSIFIEGVSETEMSQDDFMFNTVEGGAFVNAAVTYEGTEFIFQDIASLVGNPDDGYLL